MQTAIDQAHRPFTTIDLEQLRFTPEEIDAVRRGLTIALTREQLEERSAHAVRR